VPGRKGCVLAGKSKFAVPAEERIRLKEQETSQRAQPPGLDRDDTVPSS
jgi:hypothetical protein